MVRETGMFYSSKGITVRSYSPVGDRGVASIRSRCLALPAALLAVLALGAVAAAPAFASGRPLLETKPATEIRGTEATLNAVVNANGAETKYYFEYGLKTEKTKYEHKTTETSTPSSETNIQGKALIAELKAKTEYRFRVIATNSHGTTDGEEETFTTIALAKPEFELAAGEKFPVALEGTSVGEAGFSEASGTGIHGCSETKTKGEIAGAKPLSLTFELIRCEFASTQCQTEGAAESHTVIPASGSLVYIDKATKQVGVLLTIKALIVHCRGLEVELKGTILAPITPVDTKTTKVDLSIHGSKGKPEFREYENEKGEVKKAKLEIESGLGYLESAMNVEGELDLTASKSLTVSG